MVARQKLSTRDVTGHAVGDDHVARETELSLPQNEMTPNHCEILHLRREPVDLEATESEMPVTEIDPRNVLLSPRAVRELQCIERAPGNLWAIPGEIERLPIRNIHESLGAVCEFAGLDDTGIRICRHSSVSKMPLWARIPMTGCLLRHSGL